MRSNVVSDQICHLLIEHFDKFGAKQVCGSDLKLFLPTMEKEFVEKFFDLTKIKRNEQQLNVR